MPLFVKAVVGLLILAGLKAITDRTIIPGKLISIVWISITFLISIAGGTRFDVVIISVKPGVRLNFIVSPDPAVTEYGGRLKCGQYMCSDQVSDD